MNWKTLLSILVILALGTIGAFYLLHTDRPALATDEHGHAHDDHEHHDDHSDHAHEHDAPALETTIPADAAQRAGVVVEPAGPARLAETLAVYGQVKLNADRIARATPRFAGLIREARKSLGDTATPGEVVAVVESNDSLATFEVKSPRAGIVVERTATAGETVDAGTPLYTIADVSEVWIDLAIPRGDQSRVRPGQPVTLHPDGGSDTTGTITWLSPLGSAETQTLTARVVLSNADGRWHPGLFVKADIAIATADVPVAVKASAVQTLDGSDVVFSRHGERYRARPVELGRRSGAWIEVLHGLDVGEPYVTENSFLIKADLGKSAAAHDH